MSRYCVYCGKQLEENANYCHGCGKRSTNNCKRQSIRTNAKSKIIIIIGSIIAVALFVIGMAVSFENFDNIRYATIFGGPSWKSEAPSLAEWAEKNGNKALFGIFLTFWAVIVEIATLILFCTAKNTEHFLQLSNDIRENLIQD